jgi:CheY-like chemotaxis protein
MPELESLEAFEQELQSCLTHFYDYAFLQNHPLVGQFVPGSNPADRVQSFRDLVTAAIERMRPTASVPFHSRVARAFNVLTLRYLDQLEIEDIIHQLALSKRQYFREHAKALETLRGILWEILTGQKANTPAGGDPISLESEIASLSHADDESHIELRELLAGIVESAQPLAERHGTQVVLAGAQPPFRIDAHRTLLRQYILAPLSTLITHAPAGATLALSYHTDDTSLAISLTLQNAGPDPTALEAALLGQESLAVMLKSLDGVLLSAFGNEEVSITLTIPLRRQTVLVIDDNPDVVSLFRRYFTDQPYRIMTTSDGQQGVQVARQGNVDIIILDIMLPKQDGFEILQTLKTHPHTQYIPVLVCSVLETRDLALSLGADYFMKKPPGQKELIAILSQWRE